MRNPTLQFLSSSPRTMKMRSSLSRDQRIGFPLHVPAIIAGVSREKKKVQFVVDVLDTHRSKTSPLIVDEVTSGDADISHLALTHNGRFLRHRFSPKSNVIATQNSLPKRKRVAKEAVTAAWQTKTRQQSERHRKPNDAPITKPRPCVKTMLCGGTAVRLSIGEFSTNLR